MEYKEIICLGTPRSGTSLIAGILHLLGVDMGTRLKDNKFEDLDILFQPLEKKIKTIQQNTCIKNLWGFKDPWIGKYFRIIKPYLKNPYYIYIKRNMKDTVESDLRRNKKITDKNYPEFRNTQLLKLIDMNLKEDDKVLNLDFEDAFVNPNEFIDKIIEFTNIETSKETRNNIQKFINKKGYKNLLNGKK